MRRLTSVVMVGATLAFVAAACSSDRSSETGSTGDTSSSSHTITVFAASSLTDAFTEIGSDFEDANPGTHVEFNFGSSSDLVESITGGDALGVADVYASADEANMDKLVQAGDNADDPQIFAKNQAEIAVPAGNPGDVQGLEDFANPDLFIGLCADDVPCGVYARQVLDNAGVDPSVDSNEAKVTDVVAKVASGDLDAGIVYVTDVQANDDEVDGIVIPDDVNVIAEYPVATVNESEEAATASSFVDYVLSPAGQDVLASHGFLPPS